jgi:hypothetical protein
MLLALAALLCIASGFFLASVGWARRTPFASDILWRASMSVGYGLGIFSVSFFFSRVCGIVHLAAMDLLIFGFLLVSLLLFRSVFRTPIANEIEPTMGFDGPPWLSRFLKSAFAIALCVAAYATILRTLAHPSGDGWDAFAIWNLHARFLFLGGAHWRDGFSSLIPWSHPDYPLLLPAAIAHFWTYLGHEDRSIPAVISLCFTFGTVGLLFSSLSLLRGSTSAMLGSLTLLSPPFFIAQGTSQYADVPLSFFLLATVVHLCLHDRDSADGHASPGVLFLAGVSAGFAAWTKNEGLLFLCAILAARALIFLRPRLTRDASSSLPPVRLRENWSTLAPLLAGAAPALLLVAGFKHFLAPPGDLFSNSGVMMHKLLDPVRYWVVVKWFAKEFLLFGHGLIPCTLLLIGFYFASGRGERRETTAGFRTSRLAMIFTLAGFFAIYLITPYDLYWHLRFSLSRLFLQLWPSVIFLFFVALPPGMTGPSQNRLKMILMP